MLIVQMDEPGLFVYPDADAAVRDIEATDVEESFVFAYDEGSPSHVESRAQCTPRIRCTRRPVVAPERRHAIGAQFDAAGSNRPVAIGAPHAVEGQSAEAALHQL